MKALIIAILASLSLTANAQERLPIIGYFPVVITYDNHGHVDGLITVSDPVDSMQDCIEVLNRKLPKIVQDTAARGVCLPLIASPFETSVEQK